MKTLSAVGNNSNVYAIARVSGCNGYRYNAFLPKTTQDKNFYNGFSYADIKSGELNLSNLTDAQIDELKRKILELGVYCAKAGEKFGFRYIKG